MAKPKTIITYLVDGNPQWIKTVELSNWIGKAISIPRAKLKDAKTRQECSQPALYFLFGKDEEENNISYIWEAENLISRLANHDSNKNFWDTVIAFVSKDNNLTKADVKFLEASAINQAKKVDRYVLENSVAPVPNNLPEYQESSMVEFLENINTLIASMWYPILKEIEQTKLNNKNLYYLKARWSDAKWIYTEEWFLVLAWSTWPKEMVSSTIKNKEYAFRNRPKLLKQWVIKEEWDRIVFLQDYLWSPSSTACLVMWRNANWWTEWKDKYWHTLDENERKNLW